MKKKLKSYVCYFGLVIFLAACSSGNGSIDIVKKLVVPFDKTYTWEIFFGSNSNDKTVEWVAIKDADGRSIVKAFIAHKFQENKYRCTKNLILIEFTLFADGSGAQITRYGYSSDEMGKTECSYQQTESNSYTDFSSQKDQVVLCELLGMAQAKTNIYPIEGGSTAIICRDFYKTHKP